ncbi:hypothetical protein ACJJTC_008442 [Scirpophaga incertulas]
MPPKKTTPSPASTSGRSMDNPTEETSRRDIANLTEPTSLSFDRTSGSVRDHVIEGGGESPAPIHRITILEDIRILPTRTTMDLQQQQQTPVHPKTERAPRMVKMPSESPASPEEDEFRTPTRTPTCEDTATTETARPAGSAREAAPRDASRERAAAQARPAGSAREAASRDASRERATAQARPAGSVREAASRDASRERATARARPAGSAREAASRDASRERATASAADVMALLGRTAAADAPHGSAMHLAARMGTTTTPTIETKAMVLVAMKIVTPNVPQNTPATPATTVPARYQKSQATSRVTSEMLPPKTPTYRPRSRQSEGSARSDRSADSTPDRSGLLPATGPPLNEPRALVSTPTPGFGPSAPTPFSSTSTNTTTETPRATSKRAREEGEEGDSDKRNPAVRPKTDPSPASQKSEDPQIPSTSYAERPRRRRGGKGKGQNTVRITTDTKQPQTQTKIATTKTSATSEITPAATTNVIEAPTQKRKQRQKQRPINTETVQPQETRIPTIPTTSATTTAEITVQSDAKISQELVNEPVVAARQGTKAKPESGNTANETVCEALIATLLEIIQDLQRGSSVSSIVAIIVRGLFQLVYPFICKCREAYCGLLRATRCRRQPEAQRVWAAGRATDRHIRPEIRGTISLL